MSDQPEGNKSPGDKISTIVSDEVVWSVKGVGTFKALRLSARRHLAMYKRRDEIIRADMGYEGNIQNLPGDAVMSAQVMATLEIIQCEAVELERPGAWNGPMDSPDDVVGSVYYEYFRAKQIVAEGDSDKIADVKNSSGGSEN